jgi:hypothetical protein
LELARISPIEDNNENRKALFWEIIMQAPRKHIKVTYSSLSSPDPLLHEYFEEDVATTKANLGKTYPFFINGQWRESEKQFEKHSPIDKDMLIGRFQEASKADVDAAVAAAKAAFPAWRDTPWQERVKILQKAADLISERLFEMSAAV